MWPSQNILGYQFDLSSVPDDMNNVALQNKFSLTVSASQLFVEGSFIF